MTLVNFLMVRFGSKKGQGLVEYGMIIGLVAIILIAAIVFMGDPLKVLYQNVGNLIANTANL